MERSWAWWWDHVLPGLGALACGWGLGPCPPVELTPNAPRPREGVGPAPGHPERPAGHLAPTPVERALWRQLDGYDARRKI
ncbi:DUF6059 family protein [Kitasatospora sp. NPDC101183]|uniref:DUF6059 family protein n=1 Tax=Kitasatospora sp. NPDC101183 TaxID=3364100 RepID=UPI0037FE88C2